MNYIILGFGWALYFVLHSLLAAESAKGWAAKAFGKAYRFYRLFYSLISSVGLVFLLIVNGSIAAPYFFDNTGIVRYLSLMLTTFGVMTIQIAFREYKLKSFLGFTQENKELKVVGILKHLRHPIITGLMLITIGFFLFIPNMPTLISCASIFLYLPVGIYLEEKKLIATFGESYVKYKEEVPAIIPKLPVNR